MLSIGGGVLGLGVAWPLVNYLRLWIPSAKSANVLRAQDIQVDPWVIAFAVAVALASGVLFGLLPAFRGTSIRLASWINEGNSRGLGGSRANHARQWLSVAQVSLAVVLTVGACLLVRSFVKLRQQGPGFRPENVVALTVKLGASAPKSFTERGRIHERFREELQTLPGVDAVALVGDLRMTYGQATRSYRPERLAGAPAASRIAFLESVGTGFFQLLSIPLRAGRLFDQRDRVGSARVAIVSQEAARQFWPGEDPIGKTLFQETRGNAEDLRMTVVGVVGDVREDGLAVAPHPMVYQPTIPFRCCTFLLKTVRDPDALYPELVARLREVFPETIPFPATYDRLDRLVRDSTWQLNYAMLLLTGLAGLALLISAVGVYGVLSYTVRQRTGEIGLRMALGADRSQVLGNILRQGLSIAVPGVVIGLIGAAGLTRFLGSLLYGVEPLDALTFVSVAAAMLAAALLASYLPARQAAKLDPTAALRCN